MAFRECKYREDFTKSKIFCKKITFSLIFYPSDLDAIPFIHT